MIQSKFPCHHGIDVRKLAVIFRELGGVIENIPSTGETRWRHPLAMRPVRANGRRKDASRQLVLLVRHVQAALAASPMTPFGTRDDSAQVRMPNGTLKFREPLSHHRKEENSL